MYYNHLIACRFYNRKKLYLHHFSFLFSDFFSWALTIGTKFKNEPTACKLCLSLSRFIEEDLKFTARLPNIYISIWRSVLQAKHQVVWCLWVSRRGPVLSRDSKPFYSSLFVYCTYCTVNRVMSESISLLKTFTLSPPKRALNHLQKQTFAAQPALRCIRQLFLLQTCQQHWEVYLSYMDLKSRKPGIHPLKISPDIPII